VTLDTKPAWSVSICISPDGQTIATVSREAQVRLWAPTGQLIATLPCVGSPWGLAFSPDSRTLAISTWGFNIEIWDLATRSRMHTLEGHSAGVWCVQFRPGDPDVLVSCSSDSTVRLWTVSTGQTLAVFDVCPDAATLQVSFSPDGRQLAVGCASDSIKVWDLAMLDQCIAANLEYQLAANMDNPAIDPEIVRQQILARAIAIEKQQEQ
jgi:WD40 repeat protein